MSILSKRIDKQIEAYQRELIDVHYQEVDTMYRQIRGWRHDYRNHIQAMKALAASGDLDGICAAAKGYEYLAGIQIKAGRTG